MGIPMYVIYRFHWQPFSRGADGKSTNNALEGKTMAAQPNSPNGCFERHGYTVVRTPSKSGPGNHRAIYDKTGQQVLNRAGYDEEMNFCIANGLLLS